MAAAGAVITAFNLRDAYKDLRFQAKRNLVNGRVLIARVTLANEATGFVAHVLLLIAGCLVAAVQYNPDPPPASLYVRSAILLTIAILVSHSIVLRWLRHRLNRRTTPTVTVPAK